MNKIEMIIFAIVSVIAFLTTADFLIFTFKSAPKTSYFSKLMLRTGIVCLISLVYWYVNGKRFI